MQLTSAYSRAAGSMVRKSAHMTRKFRAPDLCKLSSRTPARPRSLSKANIIPVPFMMEAKCVVLFPGAAQASITWAPGGGESACAGMQLDHPCRRSLLSTTMG
eukprot:scaffold160_cov333-Pavlova_lutheri.AAC.6